ncbi:hypothetical protein C0V97_03125 [Asaia sp. W19]|uniref:calcium-binding protein n=1 Tax=unclassified Asaia TaxID=2685023 RepID=UPI000F8F20D1|nr:calcium-binding protein [Asaia sp. W19]RUT24305.1 hypothetical protein C0V97_17330 [Asaia sp. W19]RUT27220.1 hypothetical protein C0V97_03125 [Asaia sp. W19]
MSIVTIVGTSGTAIHVTVDGGRAQGLAELYAQQMADAFQKNKLASVRLAQGDSSVTGTDSVTLQGMIASTGDYAPHGDYTFIGVGNWADSTAYRAGETADGRVTIEGAGLTSTGIVTILGGNTDGITFNAGSSNGSFLGVSGDNYFNGASQSANWTIVTAAGNDTILATNGTNDIDAGTGENLIMLQRGVNRVVSEGSDTIRGISGGQDSVTLLGGNSFVTLKENAYVADQGSVASTITLGDNSSVVGGSGSIVFFTGAKGTLTGASNDTVSALGDLRVDQGSGQTLSVTGALSFIAGTGSTQVQASQATLWGADHLSLSLDVTGTALWTGNQSASSTNELVDASSSTGRLEAWSGAGNQTLIGGQGGDHFVFGTSFGDNRGATNVTVTGGSGAANTFGVLSGHTAGDVTITDFSAAAGNTFFMYNYQPGNAQKEINALLGTATVSGGNTSIMLDNDMKVTFLGVTDLKASDFSIS